MILREERRLFYVAMTHAKEHLFLTWAKKRIVYGKMLERNISPFVEEIEKRFLNQEKQFEGKKKQTGPVQLKLF